MSIARPGRHNRTIVRAIDETINRAIDGATYGAIHGAIHGASNWVRNGVLRAATRPAELVGTYVPGESTAAALSATHRLVADGLSVSINCLGEDIVRAAVAEATTQRYLRLLGDLDARGLARHTEVSVKLSAIGQSVTDARLGAELGLANGHRIAAAAHQIGSMITVDMEGHSTTDATLAIVRELRQDFPETGVAVQAYLHRAEADCRSLSFEGSRVRLCKGAYAEQGQVAFQSRLDVDRSFVRCLKALLGGQGHPMIATHDLRMVHIATALASRFGRPQGSYEFQMFYGARPEEPKRLAERGEAMRVYIPYGDHWYGYLMRRLAERPHELSAAVKSLTTRKR
ncbi:MAG: proline dehydrogenase family protein [Nocardioides sp.]